MNKEETIKQLKELIDDRYSLIGNDEIVNGVYKKDIKALKSAIVYINKLNLYEDKEVKTIVVGIIFIAMIINLGIVIACWMLGLL